MNYSLAESICDRLKEGSSVAAIAREYGVTPDYVFKIIEQLIRAGVVIRNPRYTVLDNYKGVLKNAQNA